MIRIFRCGMSTSFFKSHKFNGANKMPAYLSIEVVSVPTFRFLTGLPDFFLVQHTKTRGKYSKWLQNYIPKTHKIYPMVVKYYKWPKFITPISIPMFSKIYPNWDFWSQRNHLATLVFDLLKIIELFFILKTSLKMNRNTKMSQAMRICLKKVKKLHTYASYIFIVQSQNYIRNQIC
jgi:hypothetical protein